MKAFYFSRLDKKLGFDDGRVIRTGLTHKISTKENPLELCNWGLHASVRPLDALNNSRNKRVIVELKNGKQMIGQFMAFDIHINLVLNDVEERVDGEMKRKLGTVFLRGDTIILISPSE